jgi:hypothetical protein
MVSTTRAEAKAAFDHVMDVVLGRDDTSKLKRALLSEGIENIFDLCSLDDDFIDELQYEDPDAPGNFIPCIKGDKMLIKCYLGFVESLQKEGFDGNYSVLTQVSFDQFRINTSLKPSRLQASTASVPYQRTSMTSTLHDNSPAQMFRRKIKVDATLFPVLKDEKYHDVWHRSFVNQARAQDVSEVLDPSYVPVTQDDMNLFAEKQKFLYAVLETKVLTDRGKSIIRDHEEDFNAQQVYKKLKEYHLTSTKAMIESSSILAYITSSKLGEGSWNGTSEAFITNWQNQVRLYEKHVPPSDHFSEGQKRIMLQNAVHGIDELRQVKNTADLMSTNSGLPLGYESYCSLLLAAAVSHDEQYKPKKTKRQVFYHDMNHDDNENISDPDPFDIDYPVSSIQAFATNFRNRHPPKPTAPKVRMSAEKWHNLDENSKAIWDRLDDKAKATILGYNNDQQPPMNRRFPTSNHPTTPRPFMKTQVNLHEISAYDFIVANVHDVQINQEEYHECNQEPPIDLTSDNGSETRLINAAKSSVRDNAPTGDLRRVMSKSSKRSVNIAYMEYKVSFHSASSGRNLSLIDRGANGGVAGDDVRIIFRTNRAVDIKGIDNHHVNNIGIGTVGGVVTTQHGPVIAILHQYALLGKGSSIHSPCQMEWFKNEVNDKSSLVPGGKQIIQTLEGYVIPLLIKDGLARLDIRPYSDKEFDTLPHVFLTSELEWDPTVFDNDIPTHPESEIDFLPNKAFDEYGNFRHRVNVQHLSFFLRQDGEDIDSTIDQCVLSAQFSEPLRINELDVIKKNPDFAKLRPLFGWLQPDVIKKTFESTTQYARLPTGTVLKQAFKSPNPALNVVRRQEPVACDIVYADVSAIDDGSIAAVLYVGKDSQVTDVYGIKTDKQFVNTLEDHIIQRGAPHKLISDSAQVIVSNKVQDILRTLCIKSWQSEPYQQHQNAAERRYQTIKRATNRILDRTGAPPNTWLLCLKYVCYLLNHTYNDNIKGVPLTILTGIDVDISALLRFHFWQKVYYKKMDPGFPSDSAESYGHIVGISEHCGHALTWKVLTGDTEKIINRSVIRPFNSADPNLRAELLCGEEDSFPILHSRHNEVAITEADQPTTTNEDHPSTTPIIDVDELIGRSFLLGPQKDGQRFRAQVVKLIEDHSAKVHDNKTRIKFLLNVNDNESEEVITYNQLLDYLSKDEETDVVWKFQRITSHEGPLTPNHPEFKGSKYNVLIEWENGEITSEPLHVIAKDDPVTCAIYARDNGLLNTEGWKRFRAIAKREKKFTRMVNQAKLRSYNTAPKYKNGFEVPKTYDQAMKLDAKNGNLKWQEAVETELCQINEYKTFIDKGHHTKTHQPPGYKKIRVHLIFDVKHDGRHKARLVADGHLTDIPLQSVYSGVVSLRGFRLVLFISELNGLELWATDIGNAYLEAYTSELVFIIAGPEFGALEGHILVISKALYGLRSSGARWHDRFSDCIMALGFLPCKSDPDIWMRKNDDMYEYVAVYVDDLAIAMKDPQSLIDILQNVHGFKTKGTGPISVHLGMDFSRDDDGTLCISPLKYIEKLVKTFEQMFGESPKQTVTSPLEKGDNPELDTSELLDFKGIEMYQSMIGALQWVVTIGRLDITTAVMTMSGFRIAPRVGHLERLKRIYSYLSKMRHACLRIRTDEPDYSDLPDLCHDWSRSVYGELTELIPEDAPPCLGQYVTLTHYVDANLMHDVVTGRSVSGILHMVNKTPIDWFSKKQATVETATYGSEFVAARICVEQIIDLRNSLRYLGVPIRSKSYMFGDNKSVVDSSMQVHAKLHKRHTMLSFHRVREAVASGMIGFYFIPGELNPADILSKHWGYAQIWPQLKALLFWKGDTADIDT